MTKIAGRLLYALLGLGFAFSATAWAQRSSGAVSSVATGSSEGAYFRGGLAGSAGVAGGLIWLPNGKYTEYTEDLTVKVAGGQMRWVRDFNGNQWRFNPQWMSLEFEFDQIVLSSSSSGSGGGGGSGVAAVREAPPERFGGTRLPGLDGSLGPAGRTGPLWAISRNGAWFEIDATACGFSIQNVDRYLLKPVFEGAAPACPTNRFSGQSAASVSQVPGGSGGTATGPGSGRIFANGTGGMPTNLSGFRWEDRAGNWIEYDRNGRIDRYGDRNDIKVSMRYTAGKLTGVLDHTGRLVMSITYDGDRIVEVRDVPDTGDALPARVVRYAYDANGSISRVTDVRGNATQYGYDEKSRLTTVTDPEGRVRTIAYGPTNRVTKLTQPDGAASEYEYDYDKAKKKFLARVKRPEVNGQRRIEVSLYDEDGQLVTQEVNNRVQRELGQEGRVDRIIDGRGNVTETQRNEFNQVVSVRYADGSALVNHFDTKTLQLREQRDVNGFLHRFELDDVGNVRRRILAAGTPDERVTGYTRDARKRVIVAVAKGRTESNGTVTPDASRSFEYDDRDNVVKTTDPEGKVTRYTYDRLGQILTSTEPLGGIWRYTYDADGNVLSTTTALGHATAYEYDKAGNAIKTTDARGKVYRSTYDGRDRETRSIDPFGAEYATDYTALGNVASVTDASGKTIRFEYDAWTRPAQAWDGKGLNYAMEYTEADGKDSGARQPNKVKYPTFDRLLKYDQRNRASQKTDLDGSEGRTEQYTYDGSGRRKTVTDANGKTRSLEYNAFGQPTRTADSMGNALRMAYDARGNIAEITDPNGRKTRFEYDLRDLLVAETDPLGHVTRYTYDDNGWPQGSVLANGSKVEYTHDKDGRMTGQKEYGSAGTLVKTTAFAYDAEDNLVTWSDGRFSASLRYDDAGRLSAETLDFGAFSKTRSYTYYPNNQLQTYAGPDGLTVTYGYDAAGQLERVSIPGEGAISVTEWQWSARQKVVLPGGSEQRFEHDGLLMPTRLKVVNPGQSTVFELEEKYGKLHEVGEVKRDGAATTYTYDAAYRLTRVQAPSAAYSAAVNEGYTVDAAGNRLTDSRVAAGATWVYDNAHQLTQRGSVGYAYDPNGNLVGKTDTALAEPRRTTTYTYDPQNRLSEVRDGAGALIARYQYDPFDRRLSKQLAEGGPLTYYYPSPTGLLAEMDASGTVQASYGWHPEHESGTYPLYARVGDAAGGAGAGALRTVYYHNDHLGTPQRITDKAGAVVWAARYEGFGKATISQPPQGGVTSHLRYPGQYFDAETGLHYNDRRFYDPETGRYLTRDPIGFAGGVNLYAYAAHSPTNLIDPTGECPQCIAANYARCVAVCMVTSALEDYTLECGNINWGDNAKDCGVDCLLAMLPIPNPCGKFGQWLAMGLGIGGALNSFPGETLVHVRPAHATAADAQSARAVLKPIGELQPGDEVLALAQWKEAGSARTSTGEKLDARLAYERVTDVFTSRREQTLVHLTLQGGEQLTATEGHPFLTSEGWRDAILLKRGGQLLLKGSGEGDGPRTATVEAVSIETKVVQVFNLEVANAHTFFVGVDGALVHNGPRNPIRGVPGTYEFPDAIDSSKVYVGKASDLADRTGKWRRTGRCKSIPGVNPMPGSNDLQRRVAEQRRINQLGGANNQNGGSSNTNNPINPSDWPKYNIFPPL